MCNIQLRKTSPICITPIKGSTLEVGFIFKLGNILTGCFGNYSTKTAVIYNNDTFYGEKISNRSRSGKMDLVDLKLVVILAGKTTTTTTTTKLMHKVAAL